MRELKFRVWNKSNKLMYLSTGDVRHLGSWFDAHLPGALSDVENIEIMQYAGLKDKVGADIYDGDIVEVDYIYRTTSKNTRPYLDKFTCKFTNGSFNFFYKENEMIVNVDTTVYSVIGNIHQNPELLAKTL